MSDENEYDNNDATAPTIAPSSAPAIEYATDDPYATGADVLRGDVVRATIVKRPARMSFPISSGRAPLGATRAAAAPVAPFGVTAARRMSFPISSGRGPLGPRRAPASVATYDDGTPDLPPTKESA